MTAMSRVTGKAISGLEELEQSIDEILGTYLGDRIMRASYGSRIFELVDTAGLDPSGRAKIAQSCADAVRKWEPRIRLDRVTTEATSDGTITQTLYGTLTASGQRLTVRR